MKILCLYKSGGEEFRLRGFGNVFLKAGHEFVFWNPQIKQPHDAFAEFQPDLFIGTTFDLDRATVNCIYKHQNTKVILKGGNWGEEINLQKYPIVVVSQKEKELLRKMKAETGKPDFVFCHYHPNQIEKTMSGWREIGIEPVGIPNAADTTDYFEGEVIENLKSDIVFVGGYWGYKSENLNPTIVKLCNPVGKYNIKVFGNQKWPVPQYLGMINTPTVRNLFKSAKICPNISEPHSNKYGWDCIERPFKIMSAGGFCLSDYVDSFMQDFFNKDEMATFKDNEDFFKKIEYWLNPKNEEKKLKFIQKGQKKVLKEHTYFERVRDILTALKMPEEANKVIEVKC